MTAPLLVTGASGYIGARLVRRLVAEGHDVRALDRAAPPADLPPGVAFTRADLCRPADYAAALAGVGTIFHLAAAKGDWGISDTEYDRDNVQATAALIGTARAAGIDDWVFYSTVSVLGPSDRAIGEDAPRAPANPYGASKARCEELYDALIADRPATRVLTIRPSVVFGPDNPWNTNVYRLIDAIARRRFVMIGDGRQVKTTSYIDNLIDATIHLFGLPRSAGAQDVFNVVDEPVVTVGEMVDRIVATLGAGRPPRLPLAIASPLAVVGDLAAAATGIDLPITRARVRKFCTPTLFSAAKLHATGYRPARSIGEGIDATIAWHRAMLAAADAA